MTTGWGCHQRWLWVSETQSSCVIWRLQQSWEGQGFRQVPRGTCARAYACFCMPGPWSPARLSQKGQWIQISCFWLHGSVFSQSLLSLLHFPSRAHLFRGTSRQCPVPRVPRSSHAVQKRVRCHGSTRVSLTNLIMQETKPKASVKRQRCHFLVLSHAPKFCCNFLLSKPGVNETEENDRKERNNYIFFFSQHVPNVTSDLAFYFWHGLNCLYLFSSLHTIAVT